MQRTGRGPMLVVVAFLFWTMLGLFFASQIMLMGGPNVTWRLALMYAMPQWYVWGALTPGIVVVDRWLGHGRSLGARLAMQLPLGIGWTLLCISIRLFVRPMIGNTRPSSLSIYYLERFNWDLLIYAVIAGIAVARDYARQARDHEREAHRLQLESVELQRHLAEARLQSLRSQLQPHFLFNALNTMSSLTESDPKTARRLMEQLGQLLRVSLRHAAAPLVTLAEELTFLDDYLAIESVRFEGRITVSVRADDDTLEAAVPGFLLQPLVENAIRHGVGPRLSGGHIAVTAVREGSLLRLRVHDDGLGLRADWPTRRDAGVGLRNTAARLEQLYPEEHVFRVTSGAAAAQASEGSRNGPSGPAAQSGQSGQSGVEVLIELPWRQLDARAEPTVVVATRADAGAAAAASAPAAVRVVADVVRG